MEQVAKNVTISGSGRAGMNAAGSGVPDRCIRARCLGVISSKIPAHLPAAAPQRLVANSPVRPLAGRRGRLAHAR